MSQTAQMTGGPLDGRTAELHPVQAQSGEYGILAGGGAGPGEPAYALVGRGQWIWQGKPWPTG
ncbi:hypothetical protein ACFV1G_03450 [Streptomyces anulatus]|uniref:hypothetical protein n=1 Tax=Streptomyces anulatus TaxID=1892 RepID=UPI0036978DBA